MDATRKGGKEGYKKNLKSNERKRESLLKVDHREFFFLRLK